MSPTTRLVIWIPTQLLSTAISTKTTVFTGVPWVLEDFMKAWKNESDEERRARVSWRRSSYSRCSVLVEHLLVCSVSNRPSLSVTHRLTKQAGADLTHTYILFTDSFQLYSEELITACLNAIKTQLTKILYSFVEASAESSINLGHNLILQSIVKNTTSVAQEIGVSWARLSGHCCLFCPKSTIS
jgi:hypothetical protein